VWNAESEGVRPFFLSISSFNVLQERLESTATAAEQLAKVTAAEMNATRFSTHKSSGKERAGERASRR
jgi:hypothetical protein